MKTSLHYINTVLFVVVIGTLSYGQCLEDSLNMTMLYNYEDPSQPGNYNDVWGYVAPDGSEYGIIGAGDSILMFNVTDQDSIYKVEGRPGINNCTWRDMKTYGDYLYAGTECGEGLLVFDLSELPDSFPQVNQVTDDFVNSHNIYIDEGSGRLYVVGSNTQPEGMIIYDLVADPANPTLLASVNLETLPGEVTAIDYYIHDIFVKNDTAYCSHGFSGYAIWDVTDVSNIERISNFLQLTDASTYVHSSWNTDLDSVAYVATEIGDRQIYIVNQRDKTDIELDTIWKEPLLESCGGPSNNVPHNPYVHNDILYISYYEDGVQMLDMTDNRRLQRMAFYDTNPNNTNYNSTTNNWGVYPFLPSGTIIASDTRYGFFALKYLPPVVPIELRDFNVTLGEIKKSAKISWSISSSTNVLGFDVERSLNGIDFETIKYVEFDRFSDHYEIRDNNLAIGANYYRLKTSDYDGSFSYSEIKKVFIGSESSAVIKPTVTSGNFEVLLSNDSIWKYSIYASNGQLIENGTFEGVNKIFYCTSYPSGMYYMLLGNGIDRYQSSFIIVE